MKKENKWILAIAAVVMMAVTWLDKGPASPELAPSDFAPVLIITIVIFIVKTGVLSAVLLGLKKLWEKIREK